MMMIWAAPALCCIFAALTAGQKQVTSGQMTAMHKHFDSDGNGQASMREILQFGKETQRGMNLKNGPGIREIMDKDTDGKISLDEILNDTVWEKFDKDSPALKAQQDSERKKFNAADANGDGFLDDNEAPHFFYPSMHDEILATVVERLIDIKDKDADRELSFKEIKDSGMELAEFDLLDKDGSGRLNAKELETWESGDLRLERQLQKLFDSADEDKDSHLTAAELEKLAEQRVYTDAHPLLVKWVEHHKLDEL
eukprot:gnl/TRDRNA2_/TRDRNA2_67796_c0_seq1.p1 gnl/TRDRNA2_/TRDRNA2_67796_c0~~gnl/TRDRNA2_/TRDRNA2_67796_c0_seq1.p1  ORF type:complete len:254 (-),score=75.92 gnl/TRDRNA2_/TRDRNA2_67796_c0_seq1:65-826(-)